MSNRALFISKYLLFIGYIQNALTVNFHTIFPITNYNRGWSYLTNVAFKVLNRDDTNRSEEKVLCRCKLPKVCEKYLAIRKGRINLKRLFDRSEIARAQSLAMPKPNEHKRRPGGIRCDRCPIPAEQERTQIESVSSVLSILLSS